MKNSQKLKLINQDNIKVVDELREIMTKYKALGIDIRVLLKVWGDMKDQIVEIDAVIEELENNNL